MQEDFIAWLDLFWLLRSEITQNSIVQNSVQQQIGVLDSFTIEVLIYLDSELGKWRMEKQRQGRK